MTPFITILKRSLTTPCYYSTSTHPIFNIYLCCRSQSFQNGLRQGSVFHRCRNKTQVKKTKLRHTVQQEVFLPHIIRLILQQQYLKQKRYAFSSIFFFTYSSIFSIYFLIQRQECFQEYFTNKVHCSLVSCEIPQTY